MTYSNPKCFLNVLGDCSAKITREHFISKNVLEEIVEGSVLSVEGMPWRDDVILLTPDNLVANVLCKKHNESLSSLDAIGGNFCKAIKRFGTEIPNNPGNEILFSGHTVERWMLKCLMGFVFSGNASSNKVRLSREIDSIWPTNLMGGDFPLRTGLHFEREQIQKQTFYNKFYFQPINDLDANKVIGAYFTIYGFVFSFYIIPTKDSDSILYRPQFIEFRHSSGKNTIKLEWDNETYNKTIWFKRD